MRNMLRTVTSGGAGTSPFNLGERVIKSREWFFAYNDYDSEGWKAGVTLHTPAVGDEIMNIIVHVSEDWDTVAVAGIGTFVNSTTPLYTATLDGGVDVENYGDGLSRSGALSESDSIGYWSSQGYGTTFKATATNPIKLVITQDGSTTGTEITSTQGSISVEIVWSTPI